MHVWSWVKRVFGGLLVALVAIKEAVDWLGRGFLLSDHGRDLLAMIQLVPHQEILTAGAVFIGVALLVPGSAWRRFAYFSPIERGDDLIPINAAGLWLYNHANPRIAATLKAHEPFDSIAEHGAAFFRTRWTEGQCRLYGRWEPGLKMEEMLPGEGDFTAFEMMFGTNKKKVFDLSVKRRDMRAVLDFYERDEPFKAQPIAKGGDGGSGEIIGGSGTIIGGPGGRVGTGGQGVGGHGGGGRIEGGDGVIIGGEGGSVDGTHIWYPPARSGGIEFLEEIGQVPGWGEGWPGQGGMSPGYFRKHQIVSGVRAEYFLKNGQKEKLEVSKIEDVPLEYVNEKLAEAGYDWRAKVERKYWYLYFVPESD